MKNLIPLFLSCLLLLTACGGEKSNETPETPPADTLVVDTPEVTGPPPTPAVHDFFFTDLIPNRLELDYEEIPVDLVDHPAYLPTAKEVYVGKFKRKKGTTTSYGGGIKPEITLQTLSFEDEAEVEPGLLQWLQSFDGGENIESLGEGANDLKTPPFLVIADGVHVSVIATKCEHTGKEWNAIKEDFLALRDKIVDPEKAWIFEVECGGPLIFMEALQP